ncbi:hypothetical protein HA466_0112980 [Hirschfeldia incana]|nr:hypothetical protein HA466_0112980 [Hirschfeldia incana]
MDSISFDNVKAEKAKALRRFQSIGFLFRITEICLALLFLCWIFSSSLPFAARISGEFLRRLACIVSSPLFMFVLGNSIVVALLTTKSTVFSSSGGGVDGGGEADIYDLFLRSGENRANVTAVYDDKQMIDTETDTVSNSNLIPTAAREDHVALEPEKESVTVTDLTKDHPPSPPPTTKKVYRRSKSEKRRPDNAAKPSLRRSETEKCRETVNPCEDEVPFAAEDHLTNEEFQKTIEAFIAKQLIFRRRESLDVVIP